MAKKELAFTKLADHWESIPMDFTSFGELARLTILTHPDGRWVLYGTIEILGERKLVETVIDSQAAKLELSKILLSLLHPLGFPLGGGEDS